MKQFRARGLKASYEPAGKHLDFIFFATDTHEILVNGQAYGLSEAIKAELDAAFKTVSFDPATSIITFTGTDGKTKKTVTLPKVTAANASVTVTAPAAVGEDYQVAVKVKEGENALKLDEEKGLYVDQSALESYEGKEAIKVSPAVSGKHEVSLELDSTDKVLSQSDEGLLATLGLNWNKDTKKVELLGKDSVVIADIDATDFVKDGILNSAVLVKDPEGQPAGTYIHMVFNSDAEKSDIYVNVSDLIDIYTNGDGLDLTNNKFSIKLDPASEKDGKTTPEAFLAVTATGIKVQGIKIEIASQVAAAKATIDAYTVNKKRIDSNPELNGGDIKATGYAKGTDHSAIAATDTLNAALAKLENQIEQAVAWYEA